MLSAKYLYSVVLGCVVVGLIALGLGCGGAATPQSSSSPKASSSSAPSSKTSGSPAASGADEMARLYEGAKSEGRVSVYGPPGQVRPALVDAFQKDYPGVTVDFWSPGDNTALITRLTSESKAGKMAADIAMWGATTQWGTLVPLGIYDSIPEKLVLPEVKSKDAWVRGQLDYEDKERKYLLALQYDMDFMLAVNTNNPMVSKLKSYKDLLTPEWKGKFVVGDPKSVGQSRSAFATFYKVYGEDFFKQLGANSPKLTSDVNQIVDWVAHDAYAVGISAGHTLLSPFMKQGVPIKGLVLDGVTYAGPGYWTVGLMKQAPHSKAGQLYLNWLLTANAQSAIAKAALKSPVRAHVEAPEEVTPLDGSLQLFDPFNQDNADAINNATAAFDKYIKPNAQ